MALRYPDTLVSNNPSAYGIALATEIIGHKQVFGETELYSIPDTILSPSGTNEGYDAIGLVWYVTDEEQFFRLTDWDQRHNSEGWTLVKTPEELDAEIIDIRLDRDGDIEEFLQHVQNTSNPHKVTKSQVGLGNVLNVAQIPATEKGAANGVVPLNAQSKIEATYLPAYVDDILEGTLTNNTTFTLASGQHGEVKLTGVIYLDTSTNKSYRWSGSQYTLIGSSLSLGRTSSTAFPGDAGKTLEDKIARYYNNHSMISGLGDVVFNYDDLDLLALFARNALTTFSNDPAEEYDMIIPYAKGGSVPEAGVMSGLDKLNLDDVVDRLTWITVE